MLALPSDEPSSMSRYSSGAWVCVATEAIACLSHGRVLCATVIIEIVGGNTDMIRIVGLSLALSASGMPAIAASSVPYCYAVMPGGVQVDLSALCGVRKVSEPQRTKGPKMSAAELKKLRDAGIFVRADAFCAARARGAIGIDASKAAADAYSDYLINIVAKAYGTSVAAQLTKGPEATQMILDADKKAKTLCPNLIPKSRYD